MTNFLVAAAIVLGTLHLFALATRTGWAGKAAQGRPWTLRTKILASAAAGVVVLGTGGVVAHAYLQNQRYMYGHWWPCHTIQIPVGTSPVVPQGDHIDTRNGPRTWRRCALPGD